MLETLSDLCINNTSPNAVAVIHLLDHGVNLRVAAGLLVHHTLELPHDLEDGVPRLRGVLLVPGDHDDRVLCPLPRKLDLDIKVISDLGYDTMSDDLGIEVRVHLYLQVKEFLNLLSEHWLKWCLM